MGVARTNQASAMEHFAKIIHGVKPLTIFAEHCILDVWLVLALCCYASVMYFVFSSVFYFKFSALRILSWYKYLYRQLT